MYTHLELSALVKESLSAYKGLVSSGSTDMRNLMATSAELLGAAPAAEAWLAYLADVATMVVDGLTRMVTVSLKYLLAQVRCPANYSRMPIDVAPSSQSILTCQRQIQQLQSQARETRARRDPYQDHPPRS